MKKNTKEKIEALSTRDKIRKCMRMVLVGGGALSLYFSAMLVSALSFKKISFLGAFFRSGTYSVAIVFLLVISGLAYTLGSKKLAESDFLHPIDKNRVASDSDNYGRSEFEKPHQYRSLAQIRPVEKCRGHIYGMLHKTPKECIDFFPDPNDPSAHPNHHIFAIGASGSGKTFTVGTVYCLQSIKMGHSVIHTDPKGELYTDLAGIYRAHGYKVRRLNFNDLARSDGWDCMKVLREEKNPATLEDLAEKFSSTIVSQICNDPSSIYYTGPKLLLKAIVLRIVLDDTIPDEEKNIKTVYQWLTDPGGLDWLNTKFDKTSLDPKVWPCLSPWGLYKSSSPNLLGNLRINLGAGMAVLDISILSSILSTDDIDIIDAGGRYLPDGSVSAPCAYFVQFPVPNNAYVFPIALFFSMVFETLQNYATSMPNHKLPRQVDFFLDEFAQCGVLPGWAQRMSIIRSYGLNVFMIVQTMSQFRSAYGKDDINTIMSACATWLMLGANDVDSASLIRDRIGDQTIKVRSQSREGLRRILNIENKATDRVSEGEGKAALLSTDEIMKLDANTLIIIFQRRNPIYADAVPKFLHPYYDKKLEIDERVQPYFDDEESVAHNLKTRAEAYADEAEYIEEYWKTHTIEVPPKNIDDAPYKVDETILANVIKEIVKEDMRKLFSKDKQEKETEKVGGINKPTNNAGSKNNVDSKNNTTPQKSVKSVQQPATKQPSSVSAKPSSVISTSSVQSNNTGYAVKPTRQVQGGSSFNLAEEPKPTYSFNYSKPPQKPQTQKAVPEKQVNNIGITKETKPTLIENNATMQKPNEPKKSNDNLPDFSSSNNKEKEEDKITKEQYIDDNITSALKESVSSDAIQHVKANEPEKKVPVPFDLSGSLEKKPSEKKSSENGGAKGNRSENNSGKSGSNKNGSGKKGGGGKKSGGAPKKTSPGDSYKPITPV